MTETTASIPSAAQTASAEPHGAYASGAPSPASTSAVARTLDERPELLVAGAFAGGVILARLLALLGD